MTELTTKQRQQVSYKLQKYLSQIREPIALTKPELLIAIAAADSKIESDQLSGGATTANLAAYDIALAATGNANALTKPQKTLVFDLVAGGRIDPDYVEDKLRRQLKQTLEAA